MISRLFTCSLSFPQEYRMSVFIILSMVLRAQQAVSKQTLHESSEENNDTTESLEGPNIMYLFLMT